MSEVTDIVDDMIAPVRVLVFDPRHEARAAAVVWQRELIRFGKDRTRMLASLVQPVLFLFVLGVGLGSLVGQAPGTVRFTTFLFPGGLCWLIRRVGDRWSGVAAAC